eukprot:COSAG05_NODE_404_length_10192_cov_3.830377_5_plen_68_part_00
MTAIVCFRDSGSNSGTGDGHNTGNISGGLLGRPVKLELKWRNNRFLVLVANEDDIFQELRRPFVYQE